MLCFHESQENLRNQYLHSMLEMIFRQEVSWIKVSKVVFCMQNVLKQHTASSPLLSNQLL